jgi:hypothetical protein
MSRSEIARVLRVVARGVNGQPRTFRLESANVRRQASYRRLAVAILGLDVASLATRGS